MPEVAPQPFLQDLLPPVQYPGRGARQLGRLRLCGGHPQLGEQVRESFVARGQYRPYPQRRSAVPLRGAEHPRRGAGVDGQPHAERGKFLHLPGHVHPQFSGAQQDPVPLGGVQARGHGGIGAPLVAGLVPEQGQCVPGLGPLVKLRGSAGEGSGLQLRPRDLQPPQVDGHPGR